MSSLISTAALLVLVAVLILSLIVAVFMLAWWIIYHWIGCRKSPIEKTVLASIAVLWVISGAIISHLPM